MIKEAKRTIKRIKGKNSTKRSVVCLLLVAALALPPFVLPSMASAAEGDIRLRFELQTDSNVDGLQAGQQIEVGVMLGRSDGKQEPYALIGAQIDVAYDNELFEASELKPAGSKRPDGESWKGSINCRQVKLNMAGTKGIRVLYTNLSIVGGMENVDTLSGDLKIASFVLTAKKTVAGAESAIAFSMTENIGSDLTKTDHDVGAPLIVRFAGTTDSQEGGSSGGAGGGGSSGGSGGSQGGGNGNNTANGNNTGNSSESTGGSQTGGNAGSGSGSQPSVPDGANAFEQLQDIPKDYWAAEAIRYLAENGIVSGNENRLFEPEKAITRAEFSRMVAGAFGYEQKPEASGQPVENADQTSGSSGQTTGGSGQTTGRSGQMTGDSGQVFADVSPQDWHYAYIMLLYEAGVIAGKGDGTFGPEETMSRQDMAVILQQALKERKGDLSAVREYRNFTDEAAIEAYAQNAVKELYRAGILSGMEDGSFAPGSNTTKAEAAAVLYTIKKNK